MPNRGFVLILITMTYTKVSILRQLWKKIGRPWKMAHTQCWSPMRRMHYNDQSMLQMYTFRVVIIWERLPEKVYLCRGNEWQTNKFSIQSNSLLMLLSFVWKPELWYSPYFVQVFKEYLLTRRQICIVKLNILKLSDVFFRLIFFISGSSCNFC